MACRGVHFSLSKEEVERLRNLDESDRVDHVCDVIEEEYFSSFPQRLVEDDKAWDAMHRALADGELTWEGGEYPLNYVVLGGELLYTESDYILVLKTPEQVRDVAAALPSITEEDFRRRYFAINAESYGQSPDEDDFGYTWENFQDVRIFWLQAAEEGRYVLFTADQ
jgi:uncharacterized protein DUF1877